ncbi:hypothetical protein OPKNFCMD_1301 [Methylobacterium crusticola]|uniref:DUF6894 domain-containing protein n=1 Tax=Methylobacterium crusticola TaxID=1697972 RepID=A0ABQ4QUF7_9HYPH|nr:hypothetical protein [Methylobacterium crusticola]GJD48579.1 hypothetical protein OPKNFCMD_1301 [Methylobacterium crusticola]
MPRFHFDLFDGHTIIRDEDGVDAPDLGEALEQARRVIAEMRAGDELVGLDGDWQLVVRSGAGTVLATLPVA